MTDDTKIAIEACCQTTSGFGPRSVGPSSFWIGRKSVRSKFNLLSVRSDSISKNVGPTHWTGPDRDRTEVVHPCLKLPKHIFTIYWVMQTPSSFRDRA